MTAAILPFRNAPYTPPNAQGYQRLPETRPRKRPHDPLIVFWVGYAFGMATVGLLIVAVT